MSFVFTMVPLNAGSAPAIDVVESCRFYADTMRHWLWWRRRRDWPACEIRYELMSADPGGEIKRVADFLGLAWDPAMLDERRRSERRAMHTPTYVDVRRRDQTALHAGHGKTTSAIWSQGWRFCSPSWRRLDTTRGGGQVYRVHASPLVLPKWRTEVAPGAILKWAITRYLGLLPAVGP